MAVPPPVTSETTGAEVQVPLTVKSAVETELSSAASSRVTTMLEGFRATVWLSGVMETMLGPSKKVGSTTEFLFVLQPKHTPSVVAIPIRRTKICFSKWFP